MLSFSLRKDLYQNEQHRKYRRVIDLVNVDLDLERRGPYFQVKMLRINVIFAGLWVAFQSGKCLG